MGAKISVIVPLYKVEKYLNNCIYSILNQDFSEFDLVLIDDGSPDNCGNICDEYAKKDKRITVIHKENGGLSDARNVGIDWAIKNSDSEYLCFVDSDDYVEKDFLSSAYNAIKKDNADIVCFGLKMVDDNGQELAWGTSKIKEERIFSHKDRFAPIIAPINVGDYAVNKIYKKQLFDGVKYPKGKIFEDVYTTYKLFDKANSVATLNRNSYVYIRHENTITRFSKIDRKVFNMFYAFEKKYQHIKKVSKKDAGKAIEGVARSILVCMNLISEQETQTQFLEDIEFFKDKTKEYKKYIRKSRYVKKQDKKVLAHLLISYESYLDYRESLKERQASGGRVRRAVRKLFGKE